MGIEIKYSNLKQNKLIVESQLLIYYNIQEIQQGTVSISASLAKRLLAVEQKRRTMELERCFKEELVNLPDGVIIRDIDVMFHPDYQVDVLQILVNVRRQKKYSVYWPGTKIKGKLIYAKEGYLDYKAFEIKDYDVICVF